MATTHEIREAVVEALLMFAERLPKKCRPDRLPVKSSIRNRTELSVLGIKYAQRYSLGQFLFRRKLSGQLTIHCTGHWRTVEDVVVSVIAHPFAPHR